MTRKRCVNESSESISHPVWIDLEFTLFISLLFCVARCDTKPNAKIKQQHAHDTSKRDWILMRDDCSSSNSEHFFRRTRSRSTGIIRVIRFNYLFCVNHHRFCLFADLLLLAYCAFRHENGNEIQEKRRTYKHNFHWRSGTIGTTNTELIRFRHSAANDQPN